MDFDVPFLFAPLLSYTVYIDKIHVSIQSFQKWSRIMILFEVPLAKFNVQLYVLIAR